MCFHLVTCLYNMKKILILSIISAFAILITWCWNKTNFEFDFDNFYWYFFTENTFHENNQKLEWLAAWLLQNNIVKVFQQTNTTWYTDSIVIIKKQSSEDLADFVIKNTEKMKLEWYQSDKSDESNIRCKDEKLDTIIIDSELKLNLTTTYFTQSFLKDKEYIYIISFSSDNEDERNTFSSDVRNIKCK